MPNLPEVALFHRWPKKICQRISARTYAYLPAAWSARISTHRGGIVAVALR